MVLLQGANNNKLINKQQFIPLKLLLTLPSPCYYITALTPYHSPVAQSVEQMTVNHWVTGSSPVRGASFKWLSISYKKHYSL